MENDKSEFGEVDDETQFAEMDVELELKTEIADSEFEIIRNVRMQSNAKGDIILSNLINVLKGLGYRLDGSTLAYFSPEYEIYISCAVDPIPVSTVIPSAELKGADRLRLRAQLVPEIISQHGLGNQRIDSEAEEKSNKRPKERKISFIVDRVIEWRRLYNGTPDINMNMEKYSLEEAALKVGISKKSLDDYLLQIRLGKKYGFDFQINREEKVGILRNYVKQKRVEEDKTKPKHIPALKSKSKDRHAPKRGRKKLRKKQLQQQF